MKKRLFLWSGAAFVAAATVFTAVCVVRTKCGVALPGYEGAAVNESVILSAPPCANVSFLAAAARVCDDPETAVRLERIADRSLVTGNGMMYLDVGREWRIGATANRIIALALANGSSFRTFLRGEKKDDS